MEATPHEFVQASLDRVAAKPGGGSSLLQLLRATGWRVTEEPCWDGKLLLVGARGSDRFSIRGDSLEEIVGEFFVTASTIARVQEHRR